MDPNSYHYTNHIHHHHHHPQQTHPSVESHQSQSQWNVAGCPAIPESSLLPSTQLQGGSTGPMPIPSNPHHYDNSITDGFVHQSPMKMEVHHPSKTVTVHQSTPYISNANTLLGASAANPGGELTVASINGNANPERSHMIDHRASTTSSSISSPSQIKDEKQLSPPSRVKNIPYRAVRRARTDSMSSAKDIPAVKVSIPSPPPHATKNIRLSAVKEPPRLPELIHSDVLLKEMKWMQECFLNEHKQKARLFKAAAQSAVKFLGGREARLQKQKEEEEKRMRYAARSVALNVREFWKVVETVVSQKCQTKLKEELREQKEAKQAELVAEASKFAEAISKGLRSWDDGLDPLMIRTKQTEKFFVKRPIPAITEKVTKQSQVNAEDAQDAQAPASPVEWSEGWSEQEEEDVEYDEALSDEAGDTSEGSEDELSALQKEMDMDMDDLIAKFHVNDAKTTELPSLAGSETSSTRSKRGRTPQESPEINGQEDEADDESEMRIPRKRRRLSPDQPPSAASLSDVAREDEDDVDRSPPTQSPTMADDRSSDCEAQVTQTPRRSSRRRTRHPPSSPTEESPSEIPEPSSSRRRRTRSRRTRRQEEASTMNDTVEDIEESSSSSSSSSDPDIVPGMCPIPFLLRAKLRIYQHEGLTWLLTLHDNIANGILADEMGLGKTIQTIALLAYLACHRGIWGPHLIVAPSSVILNWETEFKRFLPGFKVLTYYGGKKEREKKRQGWNEPFAFHVCIVSYTLIVADAHIFRRKSWYYMVLDEAQNIKNFKTQKWQTMLNFNSQRRLLLTGTPLQNDLTELWALMHFLMPDLFESHSDWKELFSDPLIRAIELDSVERERDLVGRLHSILRPFLLRRLKREVEGQMPSKYEHVVRCHLTKRQRGLYDEFIENKTTKATMESSDYFGLLNILMQLRKVCNHPDLLAPREISTQFGDESFVRASMTVPSCTFLSLNEPWAMTKEQLWDRLSQQSSLLSLASNEVDGTQYIETSRNILSTHSDQIPIIEEIKRDNRKEFEDSARGISRFPLIQIISEASRKDPEPQEPVPSPTLSPRRRLRERRASLSRPDAPPVAQEQPKSNSLRLNDCSSCDLVRQTLLTPVCDSVDELSSSIMKTEAAHGIQGSSPQMNGSHFQQSAETLMNPQNQLIDEPSAKRRKLENGSAADSPSEHPPMIPPTQDRNREFLNFPSSSLTSNEFKQKLAQLIQQSPPSYTPQSSSHFGTSHGFPPKLSEVLIQGLTTSKTTFFDEHSACFHLSNRSPLDATCIASLSQLPTLPNLPSSRCLSTGTCPILEPLCQQTGRRYPKRQWLQRARQSLRMASSQTSVSRPLNGGNINLYRKILFEQAAKHNADPKRTVPVEKALAAQWVHATATSVGVVRRSLNLEYLVDHPPGDDDPYLRDIGPSSDSQFCSHSDFSTSTLPYARCLFGPRFRAFLQCQIWRNHPRCFSILRGTEEEQHGVNVLERYLSTSEALEELCPTPEQLMKRQMQKLLRIICIHDQKVRPLGPLLNLRGKSGRQTLQSLSNGIDEVSTSIVRSADAFHPITLAQRCLFPPKRALQDDCGKLVILGELLHRLKSEGHKCILFTQMSKMLDILEGFINLHAFTYVRLDGSTKVEQRQRVVEAFNTDTRIFIFMSSTRAGGVGINLIGADTVIFYDTDWNPAMDRQAMDRCHRIGQTRDVHIYRLITEHTIEENILRKQLLKRMLDDVVVDQGKFTTQKISDFFDKSDVKEMFRIPHDTSDLYVTRVLHESQAEQQPVPSRTPSTPTETSAAAFEAAIARIEDLDDQIALEQTSLEKSLEFVEFQKEFEEESGGGQVGEGGAAGVTPEQASLAVLSIGTRGTTKEKAVVEEKVEEVPFWVAPKASKSTAESPKSGGKSRTEVSMDGQTSFYVSDIVKYAIDFTEVNLPPSVLNEIAALQGRLDYFRATCQTQPSHTNSSSATSITKDKEEDEEMQER